MGKLQGLLKIFIMEYDTTDKTEKKILDLIDERVQFKNQLKILSDKIL